MPVTEAATDVPARAQVPALPTGSRAFRDNLLTTAKGSGFLAGGSFFEFGSRFLIALLLARLLGPSDYGLYVLAIGAAALFAGISQVGLDDAMVRYVAVLSGRGDGAGVAGTMQVGLGISFVVAIVSGGGLFLGADAVASGLFDHPALAPVLRLVAVMVPLLTVSNVLAGSARGFGRMDYAAGAENVVMSLVRLALLVVLALTGRVDVVTAVIAFGISDVAASLALVLLLNREFPLRGLLRLDARRDIGLVLRFALPLWMSGLLRQFRRNMETLLLGALAAVSSVGIYAVAARINLLGHVFLLSILLAVKPTLARLHDRARRDELGHIYRAATRWTLTLNIPFFLVMVLYPEALLSVFGPAFAAGAPALVILAFAELFNAATGICGPMIDMTGHTRVKLANSVLWTTVTIAGSALFIPRWGAVGAAVAMLVAIVAVNAAAVVEVRVLERLLPYDRTFAKPALAGLGALITGAALRAWFPPGPAFVSTAVQGSLVAAVYLALLVSLGVPADDRLVVARVAAKARALVRPRRVAAPAAEKAGPA